MNPYFLYYLLIGKDLLESHVKLSKIVLSNAISVPAHRFEYQALIPDNWQVKAYVPFGIQGLVDCVSRLMSVPKRDNKILLTGSSEGCDVEPGPFKVTYRITEAILIFCCQVPPLSTLLE